jgi:outer membrane protein assembly factor BamB
VTVGGEGTIYFGSDSFYAVNPDGSQKWTLPLTNAIYKSTPALDRDGTIYFVASGRLYAVTPAGSNKWELVIDSTSSTPGPISPVIGSDGTIYVGGFYSFTLHAVRPDGTEKWQYPLANSPRDCPAIGWDGTIYVSAATRFHAISPDGSLAWEITLSANAPPVVGADGRIYVANNDLAIYSLTLAGATNWSAASFSVSLLPTVAAVDGSGTTYYCVSNAVFAITHQGSVQWVFASPSPPFGSHMSDTRTSPTIGPDGTIYCAFGSKLFAIAGTNALADSPWPMYHQNPRHTGKVEKPSLNKPQKRSDGGFQFELYGQLSNSYTIQASTSLVSWSSLTSLLVTNVPMDVVDLDATNFPSRFYRALSP